MTLSFLTEPLNHFVFLNIKKKNLLAKYSSLLHFSGSSIEILGQTQTLVKKNVQIRLTFRKVLNSMNGAFQFFGESQ